MTCQFCGGSKEVWIPGIPNGRNRGPDILELCGYCAPSRTAPTQEEIRRANEAAVGAFLESVKGIENENKRTGR